jgi:hypothetical protein
MRKSGNPSLEFRVKVWSDHIKKLYSTESKAQEYSCDFVKKNKMINNKLRQIKEVEPAYKNIIQEANLSRVQQYQSK